MARPAHHDATHDEPAAADTDAPVAADEPATADTVALTGAATPKTRVRATTNVAGLRPGQEADLDPDEAAVLASGGYVVPL